MEPNRNQQPAVIARGVIQGPEAKGEVVLEATPEGYILHLSNYWIAEGAPDVHIYLSPDEAGNVEMEGVIDFGRIESFSGDITYPIPTGAVARSMRSVVVYCKVYSVMFGVAALEFV